MPSPPPQDDTLHFGTADLAVLGLYLLLLLVLGLWSSRHHRDTDGYFRGSRRIPWWATGLSIFGTQLSAITFLAIPAQVYRTDEARTDWRYFPAQVCILLVVPVVVHWFLPVYRRLDVTSAYEYLEARFGKASRRVGATVFLLFQLGRMGIVLFLPALALATVTDLPVLASILGMGLLCSAYTVAGGIEAVIWTDVVQAVLLLAGAGLSLVLLTAGVEGGAAGMFERAAAQGRLTWAELDLDPARPVLWVVLLGNFFAVLVPYATDQTMIQRYMTTPDQRGAARALWANGWLTLPASLLFYAIGTALWDFYAHHPERLGEEVQADAVFPWFLAHELPTGLAGLVIAAVFAAAMSSVDSSMNSVAAVVTTDFLDGKRGLRSARLWTLAAGAAATLVALLLALTGARSMVNVYVEILSLAGGCIGGLFLLGVLTREVKECEALLGTLAGGGAAFAVRTWTGIHFFLYAAIGVGVSFGTGLLLSRLRAVLPRRLHPGRPRD